MAEFISPKRKTDIYINSKYTVALYLLLACVVTSCGGLEQETSGLLRADAPEPMARDSHGTSCCCCPWGTKTEEDRPLLPRNNEGNQVYTEQPTVDEKKKKEEDPATPPSEASGADSITAEVNHLSPPPAVNSTQTSKRGTPVDGRSSSPESACSSGSWGSKNSAGNNPGRRNDAREFLAEIR